MIHAKHEGIVNNSSATPENPTRAFYAQQVDSNIGPVTPPNQPEPPYPHQPVHPRVPGLKFKGSTNSSTSAKANVSATSHVQTPAAVTKPTARPVKVAQSTPKGPRKMPGA
ncbi:MAG: hypothetical protein U0835_06520 [Isosphaeraceae bacterium]